MAIGSTPSAAASRRAPGCPWTCSSSRRRARPWPGGHRRREGRSAGDATGLDCAHLVVREDQVGAAPLHVEGHAEVSRAMVVHSMCHRADRHRGRRRARTARRPAAARHSNGSSGSRLPGVRGLPRAQRRPPTSGPGPTRRPSRSPGRTDIEVEVTGSRGSLTSGSPTRYAAPLDSRSVAALTTDGTLSTTPM